MSKHEEPSQVAGRSRLRVLLAGAVHVFTALGIVCALMAMLAALDGRWQVMFVWLVAAFIIDGVDGTLARAANVHRYAARFSGEQLDLVVDYVTYVFVPTLALLRAGYLPGIIGQGLASLILLSSLYHFSDTCSKGDDNSFVGFPAIWNIVAFYFFAFGTGPVLVGIVVLILSILTFIPMRWLHPMRVERAKWLNLAVTAIGSLAALWVIYGGFPASPLMQLVLGAVAIYVVALALLRPLSRPGARS